MIQGAVEVSIQHDLCGTRKAIGLQFSGASLYEVREVAETTKTRLAGDGTVIDIAGKYRTSMSEIELALASDGEALGLTLQEVGRQVCQGLFGKEAQRIQRSRADV